VVARDDEHGGRSRSSGREAREEEGHPPRPRTNQKSAVPRWPNVEQTTVLFLVVLVLALRLAPDAQRISLREQHRVPEYTRIKAGQVPPSFTAAPVSPTFPCSAEGSYPLSESSDRSGG
jgi:hypothetical protein